MLLGGALRRLKLKERIYSLKLYLLRHDETTYSRTGGYVVSHKATIRVILCSSLGINMGRYCDRIDVPAASLSIVQFGALGSMLKVLGDRSFMDADLRSLSGT